MKPLGAAGMQTVINPAQGLVNIVRRFLQYTCVARQTLQLLEKLDSPSANPPDPSRATVNASNVPERSPGRPR